PTILFELGVGAMLPIIAASTTALGGSLATAGLLVTLLPIGQILADLPAGALAARIGDRPAMIIAGLVATVGFALAALASHVAVLAVAVALVGVASSVYFLARQSYLTEVTAPLKRARVLSTLGGVHRIGQFIGPFLGAAVILLGSLSWAYWMAAVAAALSAAVVVAVGADDGAAHPDRNPVPVARVLRDHARVFATLGIAVLLIGAVRGARLTVLPLWAEHLGIDPASTSLVFGLAGAVDMLLFYPAGKVMDHFGRLWVGVPSMLVMGAALVALPFTTTVGALAVVAAVLGLGNGLSSGILMTLGADVAPPGSRVQFLGVWRVMSDVGLAVGPLVLTAAAALGSVAGGVWLLAATSGASVVAQARWVPRYSEHANRATRRRAGLA
ncbi:MAG: MFS transporter, partial [Actinomycetota bacterium]